MPDFAHGSSAAPTRYQTMWVTTGVRRSGMTTTCMPLVSLNSTAPDSALTVVGRARRAVPEVGMVQQHVAPVAVDADLTGDLLEPERHAGGSAEVRSRDDTEEAVLG